MHALSTLVQLPQPEATSGPAGLAAGTSVLTLDGELPVEHLAAGDRIITRNSGIGTLTALRRIETTTALIRFAASSLAHGRPESDMILGPGTRILIRDWRAGALYGQPSAMVEAARLVDNLHVQRSEPRKVTLFVPCFDAPQVIYASGLEIGLP